MVLNFDDPKALFNFTVVDGNGTKGIIDSGVTMVPPQYIQPLNERIVKATVSQNNHPPIDLSGLDGPNHDNVAAEIIHAASTVGFFQVVNHGVPIELMEKVKSSAHEFFEQPTVAKAVYLKGGRFSPKAVYGTSFVPAKEQVLEWRDYLFMTHSDDEDVKYWPSICREVALEYMKTSTNMVVKRILEVLIGDLGVSPNETNSIIDQLTGFKIETVNYYPPCPNPDLTIGSGRHSDMATATVLLQDGFGGLYAKLEQDTDDGKEGEWVDVPPIPGALVVIVGDTLQIVSNGRYKSVEHRVGTTRAGARVSIPIFTMPLEAQKIGPLPQAVARDGVTQYCDITFGDYKNHHLGKPHGGKNSLDFAKATAWLPVGVSLSS